MYTLAYIHVQIITFLYTLGRKIHQPVVKPNRKCCVNGKVESGALKMSANVTSPALLYSTLER